MKIKVLVDRFEPSVGGTRSNLGLEQSGLHSAPAGINAIEWHHIAEGDVGMLLQKHGANIRFISKCCAFSALRAAKVAPMIPL